MKKLSLTIGLVVVALSLGFYIGYKNAPAKRRVIEMPGAAAKITKPKVVFPAEVPKQYAWVSDFVNNYYAATAGKRDTEQDIFLKNIEAFNVIAVIDKDIKTQLSPNLYRNRVELALRRNGINVSRDSGSNLVFYIMGVWNEPKTIFSYYTSLAVHQQAPILTDAETYAFNLKNVKVWDHYSVGFAGKDVVQSSVDKLLEEWMTELCNAYLTQNPKPR